MGPMYMETPYIIHIDFLQVVAAKFNLNFFNFLSVHIDFKVNIHIVYIMS